jgi:hypothetical protein
MNVKEWYISNYGKFLRRPKGQIRYKIVGLCHHKVIVEKITGEALLEHELLTGIDIPDAMNTSKFLVEAS